MSNKEIHLFEGDTKVIASTEPSVYGNGDFCIDGDLVIGGTATIGGSSPITSASNEGAGGVGPFIQITGSNLEFKNINAGSSKITITDDVANNEIDIDIVEGNIIHQNLSGAGTNTHAQIDSHIASVANPHSVTIDQITPTTTKGDIFVEDGANVIRLGVGTNGQVLVADSAEASGLKWTSEASNTTGSNQGTAGVGPFIQKTGDDLEFKNINAGSSKVTITDDVANNEIDIDIVEGNIIHQNLSGAGTNTHAQIDSHIASVANPHSVTIDQITPTTTKGDILVENGSNVVSLGAGTNGFILSANSSEATGLEWINTTTVPSNATASNQGTAGVGPFIQKTGDDLEFKNINAGSSKVTITDDVANNEIDIDIVEGNIIHQNLSGAGTNTHAQIDSHIASVANPHSVTIDQITPTTIKGDLLVENGSNVVSLGAGTNGFILSANSSEATGLEWINTTTVPSNATASNQGTAGVGPFIQKTGDDLEFKNINAGSSKVTITDDTGNDEIDIDIVEGNIIHQNLSGAGTNTHAQIDSHIASVANPHSVTIDQITPTTTKGDILVENGSNVVSLGAGTNGFILSANSSEATGLEWINTTTVPSNATGSNQGTAGVGPFIQKTGDDLEFKNINAGSSKITITDDVANNEIDIDIVEGNIIHQNLSGAGTNTHAQIDSHIASVANPHSVTIDQITPTTIKGDLLVENGSNVVSLGAGTNGFILSANSSEATGLEWINTTTVPSNATASNQGTAGVGPFIQKTGDDLEFKNINAGSSKVTITDDVANNEIDVDIVEGNIIHQNLSGAGTNTHAQIDSHIASVANPHSVTIDQITPTTTKGDILVENGSNVVRLPVGTDGQGLVANSSEATGLEWIDQTYTGEVAIIKDVKSVGTQGGTFSAGAWRTRDLNTLTGNAGSLITLSSNQFTIAAGKYHLTASAPANEVLTHACRLRNITDSTTECEGSSEESGNNGEFFTTRSTLSCYLNLTSSKTFELQHRGTRTEGTDGFGGAHGFQSEVFSFVSIIVLE